MYINVDTQPCIAWNTSAIALPFYMTYFVGDVSYDIGPRQKVTVLQKYLGQFFFFCQSDTISEFSTKFYTNKLFFVSFQRLNLPI